MSEMVLFAALGYGLLAWMNVVLIQYVLVDLKLREKYWGWRAAESLALGLAVPLIGGLAILVVAPQVLPALPYCLGLLAYLWITGPILARLASGQPVRQMSFWMAPYLLITIALYLVALSGPALEVGLW